MQKGAPQFYYLVRHETVSQRGHYEHYSRERALRTADYSSTKLKAEIGSLQDLTLAGPSPKMSDIYNPPLDRANFI